jgi:thiamine-monophosphate kinase
VARNNFVQRSGSRPGDVIFVSGELGGSLAGRHLEFEPRIVEARWLAENFQLHALIDISDGLAGDLRHLLEAAHAGADLLKTAIPISRAARLQARSKGQPPILAALTDGEDFELLFTVAPRNAVPLADAWRARFPDIKISCIGKISAEPGLRLRDKNGVQTFTGNGYVHFK